MKNISHYDAIEVPLTESIPSDLRAQFWEFQLVF